MLQMWNSLIAAAFSWLYMCVQLPIVWNYCIFNYFKQSSNSQQQLPRFAYYVVIEMGNGKTTTTPTLLQLREIKIVKHS